MDRRLLHCNDCGRNRQHARPRRSKTWFCETCYIVNAHTGTARRRFTQTTL